MKDDGDEGTGIGMDLERALTDEQAYSELENTFVSAFINLLMEGDQSDWVIPYYQTCFANGTRVRDANPIFSAKSISSGKSVRIILEPLESLEGVEHWLDANEKNELVLVCSLSKSHAETVRSLILEWVYPKGEK
ncbi:hypothetical protein [Paenibacillus sp. CAA11]|uniref:hypothetical protein n=1 Tax=Paenibacillus sp. CAA11 TaxID=1532905 RepID=UPI003FA38A4D